MEPVSLPSVWLQAQKCIGINNQLEFMENGALSEYLKKATISQEMQLSFMKGIAAGVSTLIC